MPQASAVTEPPRVAIREAELGDALAVGQLVAALLGAGPATVILQSVDDGVSVATIGAPGRRAATRATPRLALEAAAPEVEPRPCGCCDNRLALLQTYRPPPGAKWCPSCRREKPLIAFSLLNRASRPDSPQRQSKCRDCRAALHREVRRQTAAAAAGVEPVPPRAPTPLAKRLCRGCRQVLDLSQFSPMRLDEPLGPRHYRCRACRNALAAEKRKALRSSRIETLALATSP